MNYLIIFCSDTFFQSTEILCFVNYYCKLFMTNISFYQCYRYYFSVRLNLFLVSKAIFLCLFFLLIVSRNILIITLWIRNSRLVLGSAITRGVPMTVVNQQREKPLMAPEKTSKLCIIIIIECCHIVIGCLAHLFSVIDYDIKENFIIESEP